MCWLLLCVNFFKHFLKDELESSRYIFCYVRVIFSGFNQFSYFCTFSVAFKKFDAVLFMVEDEPILSKGETVLPRFISVPTFLCILFRIQIIKSFSPGCCLFDFSAVYCFSYSVFSGSFSISSTLVSGIS